MPTCPCLAMEAPFSVKLASGKRVEGFKKRVVIVSAKDGIRVLKEGAYRARRHRQRR